jgi:unsaturated chondroitin disaccharide hydrolase
MTTSSPSTPLIFSSALDQAFHTIRRTIPQLREQPPRIGRPDFRYARCETADWVEGFWSGQLWLAYDETDDAALLEAAREQERHLARRLQRHERLDHDLGFLYLLSAVADHTITGDRAARELGLAAADLLAARFNPAGNFIRAWDDWAHLPHVDNRGRIIIDCMENLGLLFWASRQTGDDRFARIAQAHADTSAAYLVRADGSTNHTYHFDPISGAPLRASTHQGYHDSSCWSRGQSWAIHGFAQTYVHTGEPRFRDTARQVADYAIARLPDDGVPPWDYLVPPHAPQHKDSSAAAIMAAGLQLLADTLGADPIAEHYRATGLCMLEHLCTAYTTFDIPHAEGLLRGGASYVAAGLCDAMLPYGDYFFLEALLRAHGRTAFFW